MILAVWFRFTSEKILARFQQYDVMTKDAIDQTGFLER